MEEVFVLKKKPTLLLLDASSLIFRAYFAVPALSTKAGKPTNAILGMARMMFAMLRTPYDYTAACLDRAEPTFRHALYVEYKAHRPAVADALIEQFDPIYDMLRAFGFQCYDKEGYEADDLIAALCCYAEDKNIDAHVITGDLDALQVVTPSVTVFTPSRGGPSAFTKYDVEKVKERFGVSPSQVTDYKALVGDSSDNIKGVPGIGPKTAAQLLSEYGTLENIFKKRDALSEKIKVKLLPHEERAFLNKKLVTLCRDIDVEIHEEELRHKGINGGALRSFFESYELHSLSRQLLQEEEKNVSSKLREEIAPENHDVKTTEAAEESVQLSLL